VALTLGAFAAAIDELAPFRLAYDWDNVGLQIGDPGAPVERALIALEMNPEVLARARREGCEAILTHHPLIFQPLKAVRGDTPAGRLQLDLIRAEIGLIAAHTNLDRVLRGTNGALAAKLGLLETKVLEPAVLNEMYKFTVFVPREYTPKLIDAIHRGGGGRIGDYSHCTFRAPGTGTFVPEKGANPFLGKPGEFEQAEEDRLETLVSRRNLKTVLYEVMQAHPYEEVAYDVFPLYDANPAFGLGVSGRLPVKLTLRAVAEKLREACNSNLTCIVGDGSKRVEKVAIITGSAGSSVRTVNPNSTDLLITGELTYHNALEAKERGLAVITLGHAASEKIFAPFVRDELLREDAIKKSGIELLTYEDFPEPFDLVLPNGKTQGTESSNQKTSPKRGKK